MAPTLLYHCQCDLGILQQTDQDLDSPVTSAIPLLPSQYPPANYSFHPLSSLYYCTECSRARCQLCSRSEIVTHYCPACLFDVPSATVKAERNQCARNCFLCPVEGCGHLLTVTASDPKDYARMQAPEASVGQAPWYLSCQACKWDSKRSYKGGTGYVFDKSTGISAQVEAQRGPTPGQMEMDRLRSLYESHLRKQGSMTTSMTDPLATAKSSKSKLLRDLPGLENSKYLVGSRKGAALGLDKVSASATRSESIPPYTSDLCCTAADGVLGRREIERQRFTAGLEPTQLHLTSGVAQRWSSGWDQGPVSNQLVPLRVPLQTLSTLRCPGCRHILVKPDLKKGNHRFKIALHASLHLPEIRVTFRGIKSRSSVGGGSTIGRKSSALNVRETRPQSMFLSPPDVPPTSKVNVARDEQQTHLADAHHLQRGKTYEYELAFVNPDLNAIAVHILIVQPKTERNVKQESHDKGVEEERQDPARPPWLVQCSTSRFTVKASDGLDIIDADLLHDLGLQGQEDSDGPAEDEEDDAREGQGAMRSNKKGRAAGVLRREGNETVIGLRLNVSERVTNQEEVGSKEVEFAMKVTFTTRQDTPETETKSTRLGIDASAREEPSAPPAADEAAAAASQSTHSFWTCVRLGRIEE